MSIDNRVKVTICGKDYNLRTDETSDYIVELAERVDREIVGLVRSKPNFSVQNAAVFVALTSLDEAYKANENIDNIKKQIKVCLEESARVRAEKDKLSDKVRELEEKISALETENSALKKRPPVYEGEQLILENTLTPAVTVLAGKDGEEEDKGDNLSGDGTGDLSVSEDKSGKKEYIKENKPAPSSDSKHKNESAGSGSGASTGTDKNLQPVNEQNSSRQERGSDRGTDPEAANDGDGSPNDNINLHKNKRDNKKKRN